MAIDTGSDLHTCLTSYHISSILVPNFYLCTSSPNPPVHSHSVRLAIRTNLGQLYHAAPGIAGETRPPERTCGSGRTPHAGSLSTVPSDYRRRS